LNQRIAVVKSGAVKSQGQLRQIFRVALFLLRLLIRPYSIIHFVNCHQTPSSRNLICSSHPHRHGRHQKRTHELCNPPYACKRRATSRWIASSFGNFAVWGRWDSHSELDLRLVYRLKPGVLESGFPKPGQHRFPANAQGG